MTFNEVKPGMALLFSGSDIVPIYVIRKKGNSAFITWIKSITSDTYIIYFQKVSSDWWDDPDRIFYTAKLDPLSQKIFIKRIFEKTIELEELV